MPSPCSSTPHDTLVASGCTGTVIEYAAQSVVPASARTNALGMVQAFSAVGNMIAALASIGLGQFNETGSG